MIKVELTENYLGVNISGDYEDLDFLYDSIYYFIKKEPENLMEETMQNHLFGFLYDVRHAYQGDRDFKLVENELTEETRKWVKIPKKNVTNNNLYYSFNYILTDLFTDMLLIKYFILNIPKAENNDYNPYLNNVKLFYSQILDLVSKILTPTKMKRLEKGMIECIISDKIFYPQWFDNITCDYIKKSKEKREKDLSKVLNEIYDYGSYIDFCEMKLEIDKYCKEHNCQITDIRICEYPDRLEW